MEKLSRPARVARLTHVMSGVSRRLDGKDLTIWKQSCGRYVGKTLGPVIFLMKKGFIRKLKEARWVKQKPREGRGPGKKKWVEAERKRAGEEIIDVTRAGGQGRWVWIPQRKQHQQKVAEMVEMADANPMPKKCIDSVEGVEVTQLCLPRGWCLI